MCVDYKRKLVTEVGDCVTFRFALRDSRREFLDK